MSAETRKAEMPLNKVIEELLSDEELFDLTLEGNDGEKIRANRVILAVRSEVFRKMLCGNFKEGTASVVQLGFRSKIIKGIVKYCYTDTFGPLLEDDCCCEDELALTMTELQSAVDFFGLTTAQEKVLEFISAKMQEKPALSCLIFDAAGTLQLKQIAMDIIRERPEAALISSESSLDDMGGVLALGPTALVEVFADTRLKTQEFTLFRALKVWSEAEGDFEKDQSLSRKKHVIELISMHVNLKRINPSDLRDYVEPSGLVSMQQLLETYRDQALLSEEKISTYRSRVIWEESENSFLKGSNTLCSRLACARMTTGVHKWSIEVITADKEDEIGIVNGDIANSSQWISSNNVLGFFYCVLEPTGRIRTNLISAEDRGPTYAKGDILNFILDLSGEGSLTIDTSNRTSYTIRLGLFKNFKNDRASFFPAVGLAMGSEVQFLGWKN